MSAFLGPIHYWLYNKIKLQNDLTNRLMQWAKSHGIEIEEELNENYLLEIEKLIGNNSGFFNKKTIYKVKKNEKN